MAYKWLALIREEIGRIHHFDLPAQVRELPGASDFRVDDNFRIMNAGEEVENWLISLQQKIWPNKDRRSKRLLVYVGFHRLAEKGKLYRDSDEILLSLISDPEALRVLQSSCESADQLNSDAVSQSSSSSFSSEELDKCLTGDAEFARVFRALAEQEALNLEQENGDGYAEQEDFSLTLIELPESFEAANGAWWRCVIDQDKNSLKSAWLLTDHAIANSLVIDEDRRTAFESRLRAYTERSHRLIGHLFAIDGSPERMIFIDVLQITEDNDRLWTVGVKIADDVAVSEATEGPQLQVAPFRSVYELLFNRKLACRELF